MIDEREDVFLCTSWLKMGRSGVFVFLVSPLTRGTHEMRESFFFIYLFINFLFP